MAARLIKCVGKWRKRFKRSFRCLWQRSCHSHLDEVAALSNVPLLKLGPYSPALNPIEIIWSSIKSTVKDNLRTPVVEGQNFGEQRITYLTENVNNAVSIVSNHMCMRAYHHATSFHSSVTNLQDLPVGQWCNLCFKIYIMDLYIFRTIEFSL